MMSRRFTFSQSHLLLLTLLLSLPFYWVSLKSLLGEWLAEHSAYSHGLLLAPIAFYIFYERTREFPPRISIKPVYLVYLVLAQLLWLAANLSFIQAAEHFFILNIIFAMVLALLGMRSGLHYLFPVLLLLASIPVWGVALDSLRLTTAIISGFMLDIAGITSVRDGFLLLVPAGTFEVAKGCSGLRYQLAGVSLALMYVYMFRLKLFPAIWFVVLSVIVVFFANTVRIFIVVVAGEMTNMKTSLIDDHIWLGWVVFAVFMFLFIFLAGKSKYFKAGEKPQLSKNQDVLHINKKVLLQSLVVLLIAISVPVMSAYMRLGESSSQAKHVALPEMVGEWTRGMIGKLDLEEGRWRPDLAASTTYTNQQDGRKINLNVYHYDAQQSGREAVDVLGVVFHKRKWRTHYGDILALAADGAESRPMVQEIVVESTNGLKKQLFLWFYTNGKFVAGNKQMKKENLFAIIEGQPAITVFIASTDYLFDAKSVQTLTAWAQSLIPAIQLQY